MKVKNMKKEYTLFDLITMGVASMAAVESDGIVMRLAILGGTVAFLESKNAIGDKLNQYKQGRTEEKKLNGKRHNLRSIPNRVIKIFQSSRNHC